MTGKGSGKRGRPLGFRLSDASKRSISIAKTGQRHRQETKDKISRSLVMYFRQKNPISEELSNYYDKVIGFADEVIYDWLDDVSDELDASMDIITEKALRNKNKIEITCGNNIEFFHHNITPEVVLLFKEYCTINGLDPEDVLEDVL